MTVNKKEYMRMWRAKDKENKATVTATEICQLLDLHLDKAQFSSLQNYLLDNTKRKTSILDNLPTEPQKDEF